jgi:NMD protein affecting ribosome stability and mRNA decay
MSGKQTDVARHGRHDRLIEENVHDPYMARGKPPEPTVCEDCGVVFSHGRWQWQAKAPDGAHRQHCPACQRIRDKVPAGFLTLGGDFFQAHRDEIMRLVDNKVEQQKAEHPMKRLMGREDQKDGGVVITFTDTHLPRGVGEGIKHAYGGELDIQYTEQSGIVRVYWKR